MCDNKRISEIQTLKQKQQMEEDLAWMVPSEAGALTVSIFPFQKLMTLPTTCRVRVE